ncbi:MAG: GIY-YIG nuclease family protein [Minisyncoccia bacterium]
MTEIEFRNSKVCICFIKSNKDIWYTGSTGDLRKRLREHNQGRSTWTKGKGVWNIIYYEWCLNEQDARSREVYLKSGMGKRYLKNRLKRFLSLTG